MADTSYRGRFVWHELMTTDTKSAAGFFRKVIGWRSQAGGPDGYQMFMAGGRSAGGMMMLPEEARAAGTPPTWLYYIATPGVDETAAQAVSIGGRILRPAADIPNVGRFAVLADPQGAMFAAFTPGPMPAGGGGLTVEDFSWHELATTDWRGAMSFYRRLFGWEEAGSFDMGPPMGTYLLFGLNGKQMGGMFTKPPQMPGPSAWLAYMRVPDAKKTAAAITAAGGKVINGPMEVPGGGWIAQALDRQGVVFAVHSPKPTVASAPKKKIMPAKTKVTPAKKKAAAKKKVAVKKKTARRR